jgi:hypothetical protein
MFMIVAGVYEEKFQKMQRSVQTEYKFVPRSEYNESIVAADLRSLFSPNFTAEDPWYARINKS